LPPSFFTEATEVQNRGKWLSRVFLAALLVSFAGVAGAQEAETKYGWLNGKWEGDIRGGRLTMTLKVVDENKIEGKGNFRGHPRCSTSVEISGEAKGKTVLLEILYNTVCPQSTSSSTTGKYRLRYDDAKLVGKSREAELSFVKIE
jgi:hypothetical protein